eukprot:gene19274-biopygen6972
MQRLVQPCPRVIVKPVDSLASMIQLGALGSWGRWSGERNFVVRATMWSRGITSGATEGPGAQTLRSGCSCLCI